MAVDSPLFLSPSKVIGLPGYRAADASELDPLIDVETDYDRAQITIVYTRHQKTNDRVMLLGAVELLTPWTEAGPELPPVRNDKSTCRVLPGAGVELNVRRVIVSVRDGLEWYRSCLRAETNLPPTRDEWDRGEPDKRLTTGHLAEEPPWPCLVTGRRDDQSVGFPFVGYRAGGARTHHTLSLAPPRILDWDEKDRRIARPWLSGWLHWDLFARPSLIGSAHLIVANPLFRDLHVRLAGGTKEDVLFVGIEPLPGRSTETLIATVEDIRPYGPAFSCAIPLSSRFTEIRVGHTPHMVKIDVYCRRRGLLLSEGPFAFLKTVTINMGLVSGERSVTVPPREGRPTTYRVSTTRFDHSTIDGTTRPGDGRTASAEDVAEVLRTRRAHEVGQQIFMRDPGHAESVLRSMIGSARETVQIVDPYFGPTELKVFGLANGNLGVSVKILTSAEFLSNKKRVGVTKEFVDVLSKLDGDPLVNAVEVRVARGKRCPIHDRFLVIDRRVWLIGSSLSELGARGTVIVKLHKPDPVLALIEQVWTNEADPIRASHAFPSDDKGAST